MAMVMPGTLRIASSSVVVPCCFMVAASTTFTVCGVSCRLVDGMAATGGAVIEDVAVRTVIDGYRSKLDWLDAACPRDGAISNSAPQHGERRARKRSSTWAK